MIVIARLAGVVYDGGRLAVGEGRRAMGRTMVMIARFSGELALFMMRVTVRQCHAWGGQPDEPGDQQCGKAKTQRTAHGSNVSRATGGGNGAQPRFTGARFGVRRAIKPGDDAS